MNLLVFDRLILASIWCFDIAAVVLSLRADLLQRVVFSSWHLIGVLVAAELGWAVWAVVSGQPPEVTFAAVWFGLNLVITVNLARKYAVRFQHHQVVLLCAWWIALLGMVVAAVQSSGLA